MFSILKTIKLNFNQNYGVVQRSLIMKKNLLIISSFANSDEFLKYYNESSDVLAFSPSAMLSLDNLNIPYKTTEDFYDTKIFREDLYSLHEKIEQRFAELDKTCEDFVSFPYAYTGNFVYFFRLLTNLFYLEKLSLKIEENYNKISLFSRDAAKKLFWGGLTFSDLISIPQTKGLENKIQVLRNLLLIEEIPEGLQRLSVIPYGFKTKAFFKEIPLRLKKGIKEKRFPVFGRWDIFNFGKLKNKALFVIQDGYEVGFLRKHMGDFKFINPVISLRKKIPYLPSANYDFNQVKFKLQDFLEANFPKTKSLIESLFLSYHREFVGRIAYFRESFEKLVAQNNPKAMLFSAGARDVFDSVFCDIANQKDIPVFYFQHGGPVIFIKNIFLKHSERDVKVKKTLILSSVVEKNEAEHDGSKCTVFGSIMRYQLLNNNPKSNNNKALYCCSPFIFYNYTSLLFNISDERLYKVNRDILEVCKEKSLSVDIKLHPVQEDYNFHYFRQLINTIKYSKAQIIYGQLAESIIKLYGLIIFDFMGTAIFTLALSLKVPIILYLKDSSVVNECVFKDLTKRCYIVRNRDQLGEVLKKYAAGNLPCKWSEEIIDRYVYPVKNGHPGVNIGNHIRKLC